MTRSSKIIGMLTVCLITGVVKPSPAYDIDGRNPGNKPITIGNRTEPTKSQMTALAKSFCAAMRRNHELDDAPGLRCFFDPRYLKTNNLQEGPFKLQMAPVLSMHNIQLAADNRTILCYVTLKDGKKEAILLRTGTHEGRLFLIPAGKPDKRTKTVTPWILRMKLDR